MPMIRFTVGFLFVAVAAAGKPTPVHESTDGLTPSDEAVQYQCGFLGLWTKKRHPKEYPVLSAHWSPPVITSHSAEYSMWNTGALATPGIELVAETGGTSTLKQELENDEGVLEYEVLRNVRGDVWDASSLLSMNSTYNRISSISMIAPSPDWFSGFHDVIPINKTTGNWYYEFVITTLPYDAGTEEGKRYSLSFPDQDPKKKIRRIKPSNAPNGLFVTAKGDKRWIFKVAKWTCVQDGGREDCNQYKPKTRLVNRCMRRNRARDRNS